ncbi:MAG: tRNA modification GTPase [Burkholderiales bacterium]|nr:tRNA modification GTPase [Phycisphaerae bacterium]
MNLDDTIIAISSAVGPAARMIVRLSGPRAIEVLRNLAATEHIMPGASRVRLKPPSEVSRRSAADVTVSTWVYVFASPRSYTGQDMVELHLPGNPLLVRMYVADFVAMGVRHAGPGEFSARAFLNGRLDLSAAEGIAMTISATNDAELRAARQLLGGELSRRLRPLMDELIQMLALIEAGIDFSEEDISFITPEALRDRVSNIIKQLNELLADTARFERLTHQPTFVLVGRPNAGKSTLLNALAGHERAVVSSVAGTTRDALSATVILDKGLAIIIDSAGVEGIKGDPEGIDTQMQRRTQRVVEEGDFVVEVTDISLPYAPVNPSRAADLIVLNKGDLPPHSGHLPSSPNLVKVSARRNEGIEELKRAMSRLAFGNPTAAATLALNARHLSAINESLACLQRVGESDVVSAEVIALELRQALDALGSVLGAVTPDDVLGHIFGSFCIGK